MTARPSLPRREARRGDPAAPGRRTARARPRRIPFRAPLRVTRLSASPLPGPTEGREPRRRASPASPGSELARRRGSAPRRPRSTAPRSRSVARRSARDHLRRLGGRGRWPGGRERRRGRQGCRRERRSRTAAGAGLIGATGVRGGRSAGRRAARRGRRPRDTGMALVGSPRFCRSERRGPTVGTSADRTAPVDARGSGTRTASLGPRVRARARRGSVAGTGPIARRDDRLDEVHVKSGGSRGRRRAREPPARRGRRPRPPHRRAPGPRTATSAAPSPRSRAPLTFACAHERAGGSPWSVSPRSATPRPGRR